MGKADFDPQERKGIYARVKRALGKQAVDKREGRGPCPHCAQQMRNGECAWCEPEGDPL